MTSITLHPKLIKNLCDLNHERFLQKCHTIVNIGLGVWLAFVGIIIAYAFQFDKTSLKDIAFLGILTLLETSLNLSIVYLFYRIYKSIRYKTIKKIKSLEPFADSL